MQKSPAADTPNLSWIVGGAQTADANGEMWRFFSGHKIPP
jgi:hypothetical protein